MEEIKREKTVKDGDYQPLVSIVVPVHNEEETLEECLTSLINQTYKNTEIIIVDDGSTDRSPNIINNYRKNNQQIKVITSKNNNTAIVRSLGIEKSQGDIIFQTDADAWYAPDYIERCIVHLFKRDVAGVIGKIQVWDPKTWISKHRDVMYQYRWNNKTTIEKEIKEGKIAAWIIDREKYNEVGGYNSEFAREQDTDLAKRFLKKGYKIIYEPEALWKHKWEESFLDVVKAQFNKAIKVFPMRLKQFGYFKTFLSSIKLSLRLFGPIILFLFLLFTNTLLSILNIWIYLCLSLGVILCNIGFAKDLIKYTIEGIRLFQRTKGYPNRPYALLRLPYQYIRVVSFGIGMLYSFLKHPVLGVRDNE